MFLHRGDAGAQPPFVPVDAKTQRAALAKKMLAEAANMLAEEEQALQLRYLQTLKEIANEKSNTIVFPIDLVEKIGAAAQNMAAAITPLQGVELPDRLADHQDHYETAVTELGVAVEALIATLENPSRTDVDAAIAARVERRAGGAGSERVPDKASLPFGAT